MELDSAREVQAAVKRMILSRLVSRVHARRRLSLPTGRLVRLLPEKRPTIAVGIAPRTTKDYRLAVRIQHRALDRSRELDFIHQMARGEVEVRYIGRVAKRIVPWHQRRNRPLRMGGSVGHYQVTAGTLGSFVRLLRGEGAFLLSNNHVLADEDRAKRDDPILQPGAYDGGRRPRDVIGTLWRAVRLRARGVNVVDCAVARVNDGIAYDQADFRGPGRLAGLGGSLSTRGRVVAKVGRTTGLTRGRVTAFDVDNLLVEYDIGTIRFDGQIEIEGAGDEPFSDGGDSGSLVLDGDRRGIGLVFSGSEQGGSNGRGLTYANPLGTVLDALRVALLY